MLFDLPRGVPCQLYDGHGHNGYMHSFSSSEIQVNWMGQGHFVAGTVVVLASNITLDFDSEEVSPVKERKQKANWLVEGF